MMTDYGGGSPTGALAYNEDALPHEYRGNLFLCEWGRRQLLRLRISREGGTYKIDSRENFLTAGTEEFRPSGIAVSADGLSLYIADWNFGGWKRPDVAGRLLKVTYTGPSRATPRPAWWIPAASGQTFRVTTDELIEGLKHPAQAVRLVAQRRLADRGTDATQQLVSLLKDRSAPARARVHAIWALDAIHGGPSVRQEIIKGLNSPNPAVREGVQFALRETYDEANVKALAELVASASASPEARAAALEVLAELHRERPAWAGRWWGTQPVKSPPPPKTVAWAGTPTVLTAVRAALRDASPLVRRASVAGVELARDQESSPALRGVGLKYTRTQLIESVLYPSKQILDGYHQALVVTKTEEEVSGIIRQETAEALTLVDAEAKLHTIRKADLKIKKESQLSLMPEGLHGGLSLQDFADLMGYLEFLKDDKAAGKPVKP